MKRDKRTPLEKSIDEALEELHGLNPYSEEYAKAVANLERLGKLYSVMSRPKVDPNTLITAGCNLLGIGAILSYEHLHVIASKALQFVIKPRL